MKRLLFLFAVLALAGMAFGQTGPVANPTGAQYQVPNYAPSTDTLSATNGAFINITGLSTLQSIGNITLSNPTAAGTGMYVFYGSRTDSVCMFPFISASGKDARPMFSTPLPQCDYTAYTSPGFGSIFYASWANSGAGAFYLAYTASGSSVQLSSSPSMVPGTWTQLSNIVTGGPNYYPGMWYEDPSSVCSAQDYTCTHYIYGLLNSGATTETFYETHPTNTGMTAWSTPVQLSGLPTVTLSTISGGANPAIFYYSGTYYIYQETGVPQGGTTGICSGAAGTAVCYVLYSSSGLTGTYAIVGANVSASTNTALVAPGLAQASSEGMFCMQSDASLWRCYWHEGTLANGYYYSENSNPTSLSSGWSTPQLVTGTGDYQIGSMTGFRLNAIRPFESAAAQARQLPLSLDTPRGAGNCQATQSFGSPGNSGVFTGNCFGSEISGPMQNVDAGRELRIYAPSGSKVNFGNYVKSAQIAAVSATSTTATYIVLQGNLPTSWNSSTVSIYGLTNSQLNCTSCTVASTGTTSYAGITAPYFTVTGTYTTLSQVVDTGTADQFNSWGYMDQNGLHSMAANGLVKSCVFTLGDDSAASALITANIQPQGAVCPIDTSGTVTGITVLGNAGASSIQVCWRHTTSGTSSASNLTSSAMTLATVSGLHDVVALAGVTSVQGVTGISSAGITNSTVTAGDWFETCGGTADGTTKRISVQIQWTTAATI
jgi:hypothetical protein